MIARTVIQLESSDGTVMSRWSFRYVEADGIDEGVASHQTAQCMMLANAELACHVTCVAVVNSLTAIARWGGK